VHARGKRFADVMEALVGAAYVSDPATAALAGRLLSPPPPGGAAGAAAGGAQALAFHGGGSGGGGGGCDAMLLHAAGAAAAAGPRGRAPPPPLPLCEAGLARCAAMCVHLRLLPPGDRRGRGRAGFSGGG
jgi:hypothetical protein